MSAASRLSFITIDTQLTASHYRWAIWTSVSVLTMAMVGLLPLASSFQIALWLLVIVSLLVNQLASHQLLAISVTPANRKRRQQRQASLLNEYDWQIQCVQGYFFTPFGRLTDIYQAQMQAVIDMGIAMVLKLNVFEPFEKTVRFVVWQDQVDADTWRQLKIIAHHSPFVI